MSITRPAPKSEFGQIAKYVRYLKQFPRATSIKKGEFYAYFYKFDETLPFKTIKFWDLMPFTFIYENYSTKDGTKMSRGLNFHFLPVHVRKIWLSRAVKLLNENDFEDDNRLIRLAKWRTLYLMLKKASKFSVRQYNMKNMVQVRRIPNDMVNQTMNYYARTYYGINIGTTEKRYLVFRI